MRLSGFLPAMGRRTVVAFGVAGMLMWASSAQAQGPPAAAQQAQPEAPDQFKFNGANPVMLILSIKEGQEATFEEAWVAIRSGLAANSKPEMQAQAKSMQLLRLTVELPPGQSRPFVVFLDPPVANQSYDFTQILYYSGAWDVAVPETRTAVDAIYKKLEVSIETQTLWPLARK